MIRNAVTGTNCWLRRHGVLLVDSWLGYALHTTLSQHVHIRRGYTSHDRGAISYIGYNSRHSLIQLQGLDEVCELPLERAQE
jgi:hypothetical protein